MHKKELINTLENIELPDIKTPVHKSHLENNLLKAKQEDKNEGIFNVMNDVLNNTKYMFTSKQPAFRISIVAVLLTVALGLGIPAATAPAEDLTEEQVIEILQNDSEFMSLFAEDITEIEISNNSSNSTRATLSGEYIYALALIDRSSKEIDSYHIIRDDDFTDEEKESILHLLYENTETKTLLEAGATVEYTLISYSSSPSKHSALPQETTAIGSVRLIFDESSIFYINDIGIKKDYLNTNIDLIHGDISVAYLSNLSKEELVRLTDILKTDARINSLIEEGIVIYDVDSTERTEINISVQVDLPYLQIGDDLLNTLTTKTAGTQTTTVEKLITLYLQSGDRYYKTDIDFVKGTILSFAEIAGP